jgi:hypothetical protein
MRTKTFRRLTAALLLAAGCDPNPGGPSAPPVVDAGSDTVASQESFPAKQAKAKRPRAVAKLRGLGQPAPDPP